MVVQNVILNLHSQTITRFAFSPVLIAVVVHPQKLLNGFKCSRAVLAFLDSREG